MKEYLKKEHDGLKHYKGERPTSLSMLLQEDLKLIIGIQLKNLEDLTTLKAKESTTPRRVARNDEQDTAKETREVKEHRRG